MSPMEARIVKNSSQEMSWFRQPRLFPKNAPIPRYQGISSAIASLTKSGKVKNDINAAKHDKSEMLDIHTVLTQAPEPAFPVPKSALGVFAQNNLKERVLLDPVLSGDPACKLERDNGEGIPLPETFECQLDFRLQTMRYKVIYDKPAYRAHLNGMPGFLAEVGQYELTINQREKVCTLLHLYSSKLCRWRKARWRKS